MMLLAMIALSTLFVGCRAWTLSSNVDLITLGSSRDVTVTCISNSSSQDNTTMDAKDVSRVRISKLDANGLNTIVAELQMATNVISTSKVKFKVNVTSSASVENGLYLTVTWPVATKDTPGVYYCAVYGFNHDDIFTVIKVPPIKIKEKELNSEAVRKLIKAETESYSTRLDELALENKGLKSFITNELQKLRQDIERKYASIHSEISNCKNEVETTSALTGALERNVSLLNNIIFNEMKKKNIDEDNKHNEIDQKIQDMMLKYEKNVVKLEAENTNFKAKVKTEIGSLNVSHDLHSKEIDTIVTRLSNHIDGINSTCQNIASSLFRGIAQINESCDCSRSREHDMSSTKKHALITTPTKEMQPPKAQSHGDEWPEGTFALVNIGSQCPESQSQSTAPFTVLHDSIYRTPKRANSNTLKLVTHQPRNSGQVSFCLKRKSSLSTRYAWPAGSYCVNEYMDDCPAGFDDGFIHYNSRRSVNTSYKMRFCCRNDGNANTPIYLPSKKRFILYRYGGTCQRVAGMKHPGQYAGNYLTIQSELSQTSTSKYHPDITEYAIRSDIHLCIYDST